MTQAAFARHRDRGRALGLDEIARRCLNLQASAREVRARWRRSVGETEIANRLEAEARTLRAAIEIMKEPI